MNDDILKRLRDRMRPLSESDTYEAANEIERLREALKEIAEGVCCQTPGCTPDNPCCDTKIAQAALTPEEKGKRR